jgi:hypothetical protein
LSFHGGAIKIGKPLTDFEGVLTGVPKYLGGPADLASDIKQSGK